MPVNLPPEAMVAIAIVAIKILILVGCGLCKKTNPENDRDFKK
jgi:hypothetical protein